MTGPSHPRTFIRRPAGLTARGRADTTPARDERAPADAPTPPPTHHEPVAADVTAPEAAPVVEPPAPLRPSPRPRPAPAATEEPPAAATPPVPAAEPPVLEPPVLEPPVPAEVAPPAAPAAPAAAPAPAPTRAPAAPRTAEPEPARGRRPVPFWVLKPLLGLVLAVVALVVMVRVLTGGDGGAAPVVDPTSVSSSVPSTAQAPAGPQAGTITVGGVFLLPLSSSTDSSGSLAARSGQVVQAQAVRVLSTPSADSAWVGTSADDRVYVRFTGSSPSAITPAAGQLLTFTGTLVPNGDGLAAGDGADRLTTQTQHVDVFAGAVTAS